MDGKVLSGSNGIKVIVSIRARKSSQKSFELMQAVSEELLKVLE